MPNQPNITRRSNGVLYLRIYVPRYLRHRFGCHEITRTLGTQSIRNAKKIAPVMDAGIRKIFQMAIKETSLSRQQLRAMVKRFFDHTIEHAKANHLATPLRPGELEFKLDGQNDVIQRLEDWIERNCLSQADDAVADICKAENIELAPNSPEWNELAHMALTVLPVHDSFIVERANEEWLRETMQAAWSAAYPQCPGIPNIKATAASDSDAPGLSA